MDGVAFPTVGSLVIVFRAGTRSDPCISYYFELLAQEEHEEEQDAQSITRGSTAHYVIDGLSCVRIELAPLLIEVAGHEYDRHGHVQDNGRTRTVNIPDLKAQLSAYIQLVRNGEEVLVCDPQQAGGADRSLLS